MASTIEFDLTYEEKKVREILIEIAEKKGFIYYSDLSDRAELGYNMGSQRDRWLIGEMLGNISEYEHLHGRPLLSALVVTRNKHEQGDGFFKLAQNLGFGNWQKLKADGVFEEDMKRKVHDYWSSRAVRK